MSWELAPSLAACIKEANAIAPKRSKISDGTIGDSSHAARPSDHNPAARGRVHAIDLTFDPQWFDAHAYGERLRVSQDRRVRYLISRRRIAGPGTKAGGWEWHPYSGMNAHDHHLHISIHSTVAAETDTRPWWPVADKPFPKPITPQEARMKVPNAVDAVRSHNGGVWVLGADGGVFAFGGAPFYGAYTEHPEWGGSIRTFISIERNDAGGYDAIASDGAMYSFGPT